MEAYLNELQQRMEAEIRAIGPMTASVTYFRKCHEIARHTLAGLKMAVHDHSFSNQQEEVRFYKKWAAYFLSEQLFYFAVVELEVERSRLRTEGFHNFLESELLEIDRFFERNRWLYEYHISGETISDGVLFTREGVLNEELDSACCTTYSYKLSQVIAFRRLRNYIEDALYRMAHPEEATPSEKNRTTVSVEWRGTKSDAVEFIVGLQLSEAIYIGDRPASMAQLTERFQQWLSVDLKDFKNLDYANRSRKKDQTPFLRSLIKQSNDRAQRLNE